MQFVITPAAGKRLIALAMKKHPAVKSVLKRGTLVIVAGTTNGYVAAEILRLLGHKGRFPRRGFIRGVTLPPGAAPRAGNKSEKFPGDVVVRDGKWLPGLTIFDVLEELREGDVILKGANAVDLQARQAGVLIGHPQGGTIAAALQAVAGHRVRLILPVGLEKRVHKSLHELAAFVNEPGRGGARLLPVPGEVVTELEALQLLFGVRAELVAAGGVGGAEGAVWLALDGSREKLARVKKIISSIGAEPPFDF
ncbi:MAG: hypothetical protein ABR497_09395 [Kiritimatiellia bacterium]